MVLCALSACATPAAAPSPAAVASNPAHADRSAAYRQDLRVTCLMDSLQNFVLLGTPEAGA